MFNLPILERIVNRGTPVIKRLHAKNFIQAEADARLREVTPTYQRQGLNALGVDSYAVLLFLKRPSTQVCTCKEIQTETALGSADLNIQRSGIAESHDITIDWRRPLFGEPNEARIEETDGTDETDYEFDDSPVPHANQVFESSPECGICYRTGFLPGYVQYGTVRTVLTSHDLVDQHAYNIDRALVPHAFERLHRQGWVEFEVQVPKYFVTARFSIRNNHAILDNSLITPVGVCDLAYLKASAGTKIRLRVTAENFTHVVLTFDTGTESVYANIAQMSKQTDWTMFNTIGNLNVILPMTIPEVTTGSLIVVPKFGQVLSVTDVTYLRTATTSNLDWSVNTRVCQPQEQVLRIHKSCSIV